jgi:hypothetical protein
MTCRVKCRSHLPNLTIRQSYAGAARKHPSLSPSPLDEAHRARILSANIIRLDKFGHPCARGILDHVAGVEDLFLAKATYDAACKRWLIAWVAHAIRDSGAARQGFEISGYPSVAWRAQRVSLIWLQPTLPPAIADVPGSHVMYLGQANGVIVLFDVKQQRILRVPTSSIILRTESSPYSREISPAR